MGKDLFTCEPCGKHFKTERGYLKHYCDKMKREDDFRSINGQAALGYYKIWLFETHHTHSLRPEAFKSSSYFKSFLNFYDFVKVHNLPSVDEYVRLMSRKKIDPKFWCRDEAYAIYLEYITYKIPLNDHISITIKTLFDCADAAKVDVSSVFDVLTPNDVIQLLHQRKISPWLLLKSQRFAGFVSEKTTNEERIILEAVIKPTYWKKKYKTCPRDVIVLQKCIEALGL